MTLPTIATSDQDYRNAVDGHRVEPPEAEWRGLNNCPDERCTAVGEEPLHQQPRGQRLGSLHALLRRIEQARWAAGPIGKLTPWSVNWSYLALRATSTTSWMESITSCGFPSWMFEAATTRATKTAVDVPAAIQR